MNSALAFLALSLAAQALVVQDDFDAGAISEEVWKLSIGAGGSFARLEPRGAGNCIYLFGDHSATELATARPVANIAYTLIFDFFQPSAEARGYEAVVSHPRPEDHAYWWLEFGFDRFILYTLAGGNWYARWQAGGFATDAWYRIRVRNTPTSVQVSIFDEAGERLLAESPAVPHDDGGPASVRFAAVGDHRGVWGVKYDNVRLNVTPIAERDDYRHRRATLEAARAAIAAEDTRRLWPDGQKALRVAEQAFAAIADTPADDWPSYVAAGQAFDAAMEELGEHYHAAVLARLDRQRRDWRLLDLHQWLDGDAASQGIKLPGAGPIVEVEGVPFLVQGFGRNCLWQDQPSRSRRRIALGVEARRVALLLAPVYDAALYDWDDSLVDVLGVELRYADGFRERVFPVPVGWEPPLAWGIGTPPMENRATRAYVVEAGHQAVIEEVVLFDGATQAGWAVLGLSYQPGRPQEQPILTAPRPASAAAGRIRRSPARARRDGEVIRLANANLHLALDARRGLLVALGGGACGELLPAGRSSPIFAVRVGGALVFSDQFAVTDAQVRNAAQGATVVYRLRGGQPENSIEVTVTVTAGDADSMTWRAEMKNLTDAMVQARLVFPVLDGLDFGPRPGWFFPQRGGAASDLPVEALSSYGGMAWLQVMDLYRREGTRGGLYLRCDDATGLYKIFALRTCDSETVQPRRLAEIPEAAQAIDPWRCRVGAHLSIQYIPPALSPGQTWATPPCTLRFHVGDWHASLEDYATWVRTWWKPRRPCPDRYRYGFYALVGGEPRDDQRGEEFGSYDWWHLAPFWSIDYPDELKGVLDDLARAARRAADWGQAIGLYIEGMVMEKSRRIAQERGAEWAMKDHTGEYYTYYSSPSNPTWNVCPAVRQWQQWDAWAYAEIARRVPLCAMYVDSLGSRWAELCYNHAHGHETPAIWPRGCAELFQTIREAVMQVSPETAIHSEEPGCDYMALHEDGSWSHSLWTSLSGEAAYNPAGLNYFRFVLPQFKMYEIPSYRHALWRCKLAFFNGEGLWTNVPDTLRRELFIRWMPTLREHADTFMSEAATPAAPVVAPPIFANIFHRPLGFAGGEQYIVTLYNAGLRTRLADLPLPVSARQHVFDLLALEEVGARPGPLPGTVNVRVSLDPHEVKCLLVTERVMKADIEGNRLRLSLRRVLERWRLWVALVDAEGVRRAAQAVELRPGQREIVLDLKALFGDLRGKVLVRLAEPHATADELCLPWR